MARILSTYFAQSYIRFSKILVLGFFCLYEKTGIWIKVNLLAWLFTLKLTRCVLKSQVSPAYSSPPVNCNSAIQKEKERAPASAKNENPRRHVSKIKKVLAHQMVDAPRNPLRAGCDCDLPRIFICDFECGENWITKLIEMFALWWSSLCLD